MPIIVFPKNIHDLAQKFQDLRLENKRIKRQKERKREKEKKHLEAVRLKAGLVYAEKIFNWAKIFRNSRIGKELMLTSHIPTAYSNIFFFDGEIEGFDWRGLLISPKGLFLNYGGRYSVFTQKHIKSSSDLAKSVDTEILKTACEWIDDGRVWECIERRFNYLNNKKTN